MSLKTQIEYIMKYNIKFPSTGFYYTSMIYRPQLHNCLYNTES